MSTSIHMSQSLCCLKQEHKMQHFLNLHEETNLYRNCIPSAPHPFTANLGAVELGRNACINTNSDCAQCRACCPSKSMKLYHELQSTRSHLPGSS
jgi:hypothetical protein